MLVLFNLGLLLLLSVQALTNSRAGAERGTFESDDMVEIDEDSGVPNLCFQSCDVHVRWCTLVVAC